MPGGRPRKPRALKLVQGTERPDRTNHKAPAPKSSPLPAPPRDLTATEKRAWRELADLIDPLRVAAAADVPAFRHLVYCLGMIEQARAVVKREGLTYEVITEAGVSVRKRPEVEIMATFEKLVDAKLGRFGLTPSEREKVTRADDDQAEDPLDEFGVG